MSVEQDRVDAYLAVIARMEPDLTAVDTPAALASIAISLKRIADAVSSHDALHQAIYNAIAIALHESRIGR